jgi:hypothetical protein
VPTTDTRSIVVSRRWLIEFERVTSPKLPLEMNRSTAINSQLQAWGYYISYNLDAERCGFHIYKVIPN